ncbi:unnamed protein product [Coregonus sp. 'balchen']|nr:unnamed protein product [Coregonus sp. 'balchen']
MAGSYLAGKAFSLADVLVFPNIAYSFRSELSAERYPKLGAYYTLMKDRPSSSQQVQLLFGKEVGFRVRLRIKENIDFHNCLWFRF